MSISNTADSIKMTQELLPDVVLFHIVPRLPAKAVVRFRSVCKQWNSFLKTRVFYNLHHHHVTNNNHHDQKLFLMSLTNPFKFFSINCEAPDHGFLSLTAPFEANDDGDLSILASCSGMICLGMKKYFCDDEYADLILWNPFTSEYKTLSRTNSHTECYEETYDGFVMYYTSSEDDYRILRLTNSCNAYIYSLKSDSWRKILSSETPPQSDWNFYCWMPRVVLDEKVYFLNQNEGNIWIIKFDTKTEKFTKIATQFGERKVGCRSFTVERGFIHLRVRDYHERRIEVLRMSGDGGDWTAMETYFPKPGLNSHMQPLHLMRNGNWLMEYQCNLYNVDMEKYNNDNDDFHPLNEEEMDIVDEGKYIETFVSPNRYM